MSQFWAVLILLGLATVHNHVGRVVADFYHLGVCYEKNGNNLPDSKTAVELCNKYGFKKIRLWRGDRDALEALVNQNIAVTIGVKNEEIPSLVDRTFDGADVWYRTNLKPYIGQVVFEYIVVGEDAITSPFSDELKDAISNIRRVLARAGQESIKVTTAVSTSVLGATFPPSNGVFKPELKAKMAEIVEAIRNFTVEPALMVNVFPYNYYAQGIIPQDFATFSKHKAYIWDGKNGYWNMIDALLDAFYSALAKEGVTNVKLVVGASGWPSAGNGEFTTPTLAAKYNQNFMRRIVRSQGTPARPEQKIDGFVYNLFDDNEKQLYYLFMNIPHNTLIRV
ncbi:Glucan endo-1,3-beta-glucosidase, acidic isoform PR-Q' [Morella rubra]|uniref:glucan endo-1,3-beta-D-glucosidase n=1 Tax=Morella rubra TaxID=262757 RepID=A0A6A1WCF2_9ROSI|nr:Glucan endo-1,3-beta-glucosidase, acidic isoform PR-Q' [Morella rubra]